MSVSSVLAAPVTRNASSSTGRRDTAPRPLALFVAALVLCLGMLAPVAAFVLSTPSNQGGGLAASCFESNTSCRINAFAPNASHGLR
uniref:hypothetical protein n=1 Tax=Stappia sp. TaxID=1870903 RepID=UPI003BAC6BFD